MTPSRFIRGIRNRFWFWVARRVKFYLAHTHLIWGDASKVHIGKNVDMVDAILNCRSGSITIEDNVFFGHGVLILTGTHDYSETGLDRQRSVPSSGHDIIIHKGAWLASNVIVIGPCEIGEDSVICAGSIVDQNVPPRCIYSGQRIGSVRPISPRIERNVARPVQRLDRAG